MAEPDEPQPGPTGEFPRGKLNEDDCGELLTTVTNDASKVFIKFGVPVAWLGLDPQGAVDFASMIIAHARMAAKEAGIVLRVQL